LKKTRNKNKTMKYFSSLIVIVAMMALFLASFVSGQASMDSEITQSAMTNDSIDGSMSHFRGASETTSRRLEDSGMFCFS
jgi:hypothetical protein